MATPVNCPNCGSQLPPGAPECARCGQRFDTESEPTAAAVHADAPPPPPKAASATPSPRAKTGTGPASSGDVGKALQEYVRDARERWGLEPTPYFIAIFVLLGISFVIGTIAHVSLLTSSTPSIDRRLDDLVWLTTVGGLSFLALLLAIVVRHEAPKLPAETDVHSPDLRAAIAISGLVIIFSLIAIITGQGGQDETQESWIRYGTLFAFIAATLMVLSQCVPAMVSTYKSTVGGLVVAVVAIVALLIGQVQGLSSTQDSYIGGLAWQAAAINILIVDLGWFLGMQRRRR